MAGAWSGFTDEDLRKMRKSSQEGEERPRVKRVARQPKASTSQRPKVNKTEPALEDAYSKLPPEARLTTEEKHNIVDPPTETQNQTSTEKEIPEKTKVPEGTESEEKSVKEVKELDEQTGLSAELENALKFQQQQKVIEEANKQKKALLSKAIEERRKKAKAESAKLLKIQRELSHLDSLLTADVGIIRDKIEIASLDYVQAQKRYEKAEREFVESKMDLFEKSEAKEKLTEHLYTIIHQNEVRKAKKLVELMEELAMEVSAEEMEVAIPSIPPLTNFNAVTTLHMPGHWETELDNKNNARQEQNVVKTQESGNTEMSSTTSLSKAVGQNSESDSHVSEPTAANRTSLTNNDSSSALQSEQKHDGEKTANVNTDHNSNEKVLVSSQSAQPISEAPSSEPTAQIPNSVDSVSSKSDERTLELAINGAVLVDPQISQTLKQKQASNSKEEEIQKTKASLKEEEAEYSHIQQ